MKKYILLLLSVLGFTPAFSQGIYSFMAGTGTVSTYGSYYTPTLQGVLLKNIFPHVYLGVAVDFRYYSFVYQAEHEVYSNPNYGNVENIYHHSLYNFVSPMIDISISGNEYIHLFANIGPGISLSTNETTNYIANNIGGLTIHNEINTSGNKNFLVYQYGYGISEHIPISRFWTLTLSQQYSVLQRDLNTGFGKAPQLRTNYICFCIGISHSFRKIYEMR